MAAELPSLQDVPIDWRAATGEVTLDGQPALFRSTPHALMALRLAYRRDVLGESAGELAAAEERYRAGWERYVAHGAAMQEVVAALNVGDVAAAPLWNAIDQQAVDAAFRTAIGEREKVGDVNLGWLAWKRYGLVADPSHTAPRERRDRAARPSDHNAAWLRAGGVCSGCGTLTISDAQRTRLHRAISRSALFDLERTYVQYHGKVAPLWREVTIAAKGVAEHIVPRSQGGRTDVSNLTNCCSACNYGRGDTSLTAARIAAYRRPISEVGTPTPSGASDAEELTSQPASGNEAR